MGLWVLQALLSIKNASSPAQDCTLWNLIIHVNSNGKFKRSWKSNRSMMPEVLWICFNQSTCGYLFARSGLSRQLLICLHGRESDLRIRQLERIFFKMFLTFFYNLWRGRSRQMHNHWGNTNYTLCLYTWEIWLLLNSADLQVSDCTDYSGVLDQLSKQASSPSLSVS